MDEINKENEEFQKRNQEIQELKNEIERLQILLSKPANEVKKSLVKMEKYKQKYLLLKKENKKKERIIVQAEEIFGIHTVYDKYYTPSKVSFINASREECQECFYDGKDEFTIKLTCKHYICVGCIIQNFKKVKTEIESMKFGSISKPKHIDVKIACPIRGCNEVIPLPFLIATREEKIISKVVEIEKMKNFVTTKCCNSLIHWKKVQELTRGEEHNFKCSLCDEDVCKLCFEKYNVESSKCSSNSCDFSTTVFDFLRNLKDRMYNFHFFDDDKKISRVGKIPGCRLCPLCKDICCRMDSQHNDKTMVCGNKKCGAHFCFICLDVNLDMNNDNNACFVNGWGYCELKPIQKESDFKKRNSEK